MDILTEPEANADSSDNAAVAATDSAPAVDKEISRRLSRTKSGRVTKDRIRGVSLKKSVEMSNDMPREASISTTEPEASVQNMGPEASIQNMESGVSIHATGSGAPINPSEPEAPHNISLDPAWSAPPRLERHTAQDATDDEAANNTVAARAPSQTMEVEEPAQPNNTPTTESPTNLTATEIPPNVYRFSTSSSSEAVSGRVGAQTDDMDIEAANNTVVTGAPIQTMQVQGPNNTATPGALKISWAKFREWLPARDVCSELFDRDSRKQHMFWDVFLAVCFAVGTISHPFICRVSFDSGRSTLSLGLCERNAAVCVEDGTSNSCAQTNDLLCENPDYIIAMKVLTTTAIVAAAGFHLRYEGKRVWRLILHTDKCAARETSRVRAPKTSRRRADALIFWLNWTIFDLAVLGGWSTILAKWWPASQWPAWLIGWAICMVWVIGFNNEVRYLDQWDWNENNPGNPWRRSHARCRLWYRCCGGGPRIS
jgi:hypothetical protein